MGKAKVLYISGSAENGINVQSNFIDQCNGIGSDVSITLNLLGISGMESHKKRGFNVLLLDLSVIESEIERGLQAAKTFFKKEPENPIIIFCDNNDQLIRAMVDNRIEDLTSYVFRRGDSTDFQKVCGIVADFVDV